MADDDATAPATTPTPEAEARAPEAVTPQAAAPLSEGELDAIAGGLNIFIKPQAPMPGEMPIVWQIVSPR